MNEQIQQIVRFVRQEAEEKANEISVSEEEFNIEKLQLVEAEKKIRQEYQPEDMSSFLQILLDNSSSSAADTCCAPPPGSLFSGSGRAAAVLAESSSRIKISDAGNFYSKDSDQMISSDKNLVSSCEGSEASENPVNPAPPRSSKRSRAAEVHNLSEKRRRSRINEKLKALQTLIPNSNKTDKASMLDEAIEYLKQLHLQVQMLTMRNGMNYHPVYSLGSIQSMLVPPSEDFNRGNMFLNANRGTDPLSRHQEIFMPSAAEAINQPSSAQPVVNHSLMTNANSGIPTGFLPSMQGHDGLLNHLASSKDVCRDDTLSRLHLDISYSGNTSSPGISS